MKDRQQLHNMFLINNWNGDKWDQGIKEKNDLIDSVFSNRPILIRGVMCRYRTLSITSKNA